MFLLLAVEVDIDPVVDRFGHLMPQRPTLWLGFDFLRLADICLVGEYHLDIGRKRQIFPAMSRQILGFMGND